MYTLNNELAHMLWALSCLSLSNATQRCTSILERFFSWSFFKKGWGFLDQVESSTLSVDPVQLLASMAAACRVSVTISVISGNMGYSENRKSWHTGQNKNKEFARREISNENIATCCWRSHYFNLAVFP